MIEERDRILVDPIMHRRAKVGPRKVTGTREIDEVLGSRADLVRSARSLDERCDPEVDRASLVHHRRRELPERLVPDEWLDVRRKREHRLHVRQLPGRPRSREAHHRVSAERVPGQRDSPDIDASREIAIVSDGVEDGANVVGAIDERAIVPSLRILKRLLRARASPASALLLHAAAARVPVLRRDHEVAAIRQRFREEGGLRGAAVEAVREDDERRSRPRRVGVFLDHDTASTESCLLAVRGLRVERTDRDRRGGQGECRGEYRGSRHGDDVRDRGERGRSRGGDDHLIHSETRLGFQD